MLASTASGLALGLSLIVAIGAQNLFVLRQGIRREHALAVALVCAASDAILIAVGVSGLGAVLHAVPWLIGAVRWAGAVFLAVYAVLAARRSLRPGAEVLDAGAARAAGRRGAPLLPVLLTCLALTWLNPHVYLDTVALLGTISTRFPGSEAAFVLGAASASVLFFFALGYGAAWLRPVFARPGAWRALEAMIALVMGAIALKLALGR